MSAGATRREAYTMATDLDLIRRYVASSDARAFAQLAARHRDMVYATCYRVLGNSADAEDAAQECFVALARSAGRVSASVAGWLHRVAARTAAALVERQRASREREQRAAQAALASDDGAPWEDVRPYVDQAIDQLPDRLRVPLVLYYLEGHDQATLAEELRLSQSAVSRRLSRGVEEVRSRLRKSGVLAGAAALATFLTSETSHAAPASLSAELGRLAVSGVGGGGTVVGTGSGVASALPLLGMWQVQVAAVVTLVVVGGVATYSYTSHRGRSAALSAAAGARPPQVGGPQDEAGTARAVAKNQRPTSTGEPAGAADGAEEARTPPSPSQRVHVAAGQDRGMRIAQAPADAAGDTGAVSKADTEPKSADELIADLKHDDAAVRAAAAAAIAAAVDRTQDSRPFVAAIPWLIEMLTDKVAAVRANAARAFTLVAAFQEITDAWRPGVQVLLRMADDEDADARHRAIWGLRVFARDYGFEGYRDLAAQYIGAFTDALGDPDGALRLEAAWGLQNIVGGLRDDPEVLRAAPTLAKALSDPEPPVRARAAEALSLMLLPGNSDLIATYEPQVEALLADPEPYPRAVAAWGLSHVARRHGNAGLLDKTVTAMMELLDADDPVAVARAGRALYSAAKAEDEPTVDLTPVVPALARALREGGMDADIPAAEAFTGLTGMIADPLTALEAVPPLMEAMRNPACALKAAWALRNIGTSYPDPAMLEAVAQTQIRELRSPLASRRRMAAEHMRYLAYTTNVPASTTWAPAVPALIDLLRDEDPTVSEQAARTCGALAASVTDGAVLTPVFEALVAEIGPQSAADQWNVILATRCLGARVEDTRPLRAALPRLAEALEDEDEKIRSVARGAICRLAPRAGDCPELEATMPVLIASLERAAEEGTSTLWGYPALGQTAAVLGDRPVCADALGILLEALKSPGQPATSDACQGLWYHSRHGKPLPIVAEGIPSLDSALWLPAASTLSWAVRLIAEVDSPDSSAWHPVVRRLTERMRDPDVEKRRLATAGVAYLGSKVESDEALSPAVRELAKALSDADHQVRFQAAAALGSALPGIETEAVHQACVDPLVALMGDTDEHMRWAAARALAAVAPMVTDSPTGEEALAALVDGLRDESPIVREECVDALKALDSPRALETPQAARGSDSPGRVVASARFDNGPEGWTFYGNGWGIHHHAEAGNPSGCIAYGHQGGNGRHGFQAPGEFLGDMSAAYGGRLTYDLRSTVGMWPVPGGVDDVVLFGAGTRIVADLPYDPAAAWTPYSVALDESGGWRKVTQAGPPATQEDIRQVLADLQVLRIRARFNADAEMPRLDNVVLYAGPAE